MAIAPTHSRALRPPPPAARAASLDGRPVLPADLAAALFSQGHVVSLPAGQILFRAGAPGDGCYRLDEGLLKVTMASPETERAVERILAILGGGALVGELSMLDGAPRSASVVAIRDSKLRFVSRAEFDEFARAHPDVYRHITLVLAGRLRAIDEALTATSFLTLKGRVARALFGLADAFGKDVGAGRVLINQKVSQRDLAAMAGIARENLSRILQDWMRRKLLSRLAGYYCVENKSALEAEAAPAPAAKEKAAVAEEDDD
jgi:CRP/FNR family cyclic AMP-dependent transcriptional regulator